MKTSLRSIVWLALIVWLGGLFFFPITAWAAFSTLPNTHAAGTIVAMSLRVLHHEGLVAGTLIVIFLALGRITRAYGAGALLGIVLTLAMLGLTAWSQFWIIPKMETYRLAAGGAIDNVPRTDPRHVAFDHLHVVSEDVEEGVMFAGVLLVVVLAHDMGTRPRVAVPATGTGSGTARA